MARHTRELLREYHRRGLTRLADRHPRCPGRLVRHDPGREGAVRRPRDYIDQTYNNAAPEKRSAVGFVLTIYQRRLASSFYALQQTLNKRLANMGGSREEDLSQDETGRRGHGRGRGRSPRRARPWSRRNGRRIRDLLKAIAKIGHQHQGPEAEGGAGDAFADGYDSAIVFTQYADTMDFLRTTWPRNYRDEPIACYSGPGGKVRDRAGFWTECSKEQIKQRLKAEAIKFLVCTDAAAEGLNFQFCGLLVNYDLPWNPMKVEQRIGRIDRIGQSYPKIRVINLAYQDTVEADVYFALGHGSTSSRVWWAAFSRSSPGSPKQFEEVALEKKENSEAARHRLLADMRARREAEECSLDIDEVAADALEMPDLRSPL